MTLGVPKMAATFNSFNAIVPKHICTFPLFMFQETKNPWKDECGVVLGGILKARHYARPKNERPYHVK